MKMSPATETRVIYIRLDLEASPDRTRIKESGQCPTIEMRTLGLAKHIREGDPDGKSSGRESDIGFRAGRCRRMRP